MFFCHMYTVRFGRERQEAAATMTTTTATGGSAAPGCAFKLSARQRRQPQGGQEPGRGGGPAQSSAPKRSPTAQRPPVFEAAGHPARGPRWAAAADTQAAGSTEPTARWANVEDLRGALTLGTFRDRTLSTAARAEALSVVRLLGMQADVVDVLGSTAVVRVVRLRLGSPDAAFEAIRRLRQRPIISDLTVGNVWGRPARNQAEIARVAPIGRAVKALNGYLEEARLRGRRMLWSVEGYSVPGQEAVYISFDGITTEAKLMHRDREGTWHIDDGVYEVLELGT